MNNTKFKNKIRFSEFDCLKNEKVNRRYCFLLEAFNNKEMTIEDIDKMELCLKCDVFKRCVDFIAFKKIIRRFFIILKKLRKSLAKDRERLKNVNDELNQSLSDVFDALRRISAGDPTVRIPEKSNIKLIKDLKKMVNITAKNIAEIVDQSHEFAITLAEYFDVLHKVSLGNLDVRVKGKSKIELLESLKKVTNEMIEKISVEITERKKAEEALKKLSIVDDLTGLYNRRGFFIFAEQQFKIADRMKKKLYLLYSDLDGLKLINDKYGHAEGDAALIEVANVLRKTFRSSDVIARISGDEFVVLAMETLKTNPEVLIDRLNKKIEEHNSKRGTDYELSLSTGFSVYDPKNPISIEELMATADKDMYEDKLLKRSVSIL